MKTLQCRCFITLVIFMLNFQKHDILQDSYAVIFKRFENITNDTLFKNGIAGFYFMRFRKSEAFTRFCCRH